MMMSFIWPGGSFSKIRGGWYHCVRCDPGGVALAKVEKRRPLGRLLKEGHWEAFLEDMEIVKAVRWAYHPSHKGMFAQEGSYDLMSIFREMAQETNLLNIEIHEVQEVWASGWELKATNHAAKKEVQFSAPYCQLSHPTSWGWRQFTPLRPYIGKPVTHTVPGVAMRGRMRAP